eukprot:COSAG05_NODE_1173_length_5620_cov_18.750589_3_plen_130_part_00
MRLCFFCAKLRNVFDQIQNGFRHVFDEFLITTLATLVGCADDSTTTRVVQTIAVGDQVEADWDGLGRWYGARVTAAHQDGTFDLEFWDEDKADHMPRDRVRLLQSRRAQSEVENITEQGNGDNSLYCED